MRGNFVKKLFNDLAFCVIFAHSLVHFLYIRISSGSRHNMKRQMVLWNHSTFITHPHAIFNQPNMSTNLILRTTSLFT